MAIAALGIVEVGLHLAVGDNTSVAVGLLCLFPMGKGFKYVTEIGGDAIKGGSKAKNLYKAEGLLKIDLQKFGNNDLLKKWVIDNLKHLPNSGNSSIKKLIGNADDAFKFFKNQIDVSTLKEVNPGVFIGKDANGLTFTYRAVSKSGPPTIDVNGVKGLRKIKFLEE
ncbi:hypothetical protein A0J52_01690 [Clostridium sporogenes]|uniref:hypothetical protein n=1 Tax=Clostridium sporogenes TaxID=1509 RepID=UPI00077FFBAB|nr:hypothetical protein [Clostridium sporogenes]KYN78022.1 hypothetical protein A0J52_01690 [Clostridium sporogenes]